MKKIYWRPRAVSRTALLLISLVSLAGLLLVEFKRTPVEQPFYKEKVAAARLADKCFTLVREQRLKLGHYIDTDVDPASTGLIGLAMSDATSVSGVLPAKQTSANPNFAAVIVEMLKKAGVQRGDTVAIGYSGSFPALNICVEAAVQTLELKPIGISSAAASQWGANIPDFLWLDMEAALEQADLISFRSVAASLGGVEDRGLGMAQLTRATLRKGIERAKLPLLDAESFTESVDKRMKIYDDRSSGSPIRAYINVGGGTTSVGKSLGKKVLHSGLNFKLPRRALAIDSVMTRFLKRGVPVIHLVRVNDIAQRYGLPVSTGLPDEQVQSPSLEAGQGQVFFRQEYSALYASGVLLVILASLYAFIRSDWGFRIFQTAGRRKETGHPEPMV